MKLILHTQRPFITLIKSFVRFLLFGWTGQGSYDGSSADWNAHPFYENVSMKIFSPYHQLIETEW